MTNELKPCPFCGSTQIYVTHTRYYYNEDTVCVFCNSCKQHVILEDNEAEGLNDKTRERAIAAWNTRTERTCEMHRYRNALGLIDEWQCSECGADVSGIADDTPPNYCPNCGAKVVE